MSVTEIISLVVKKLFILLYRVFNIKLFGSSVVLFGCPKIIFSKKVKFGRNVRINDNVFIHGAGGVIVGEGSTLSYGATLISTGYDTGNWDINKVNKSHINKRIKIGQYVWVGANVTVLPGVEIADGVIVGAGSVVTKDLIQKNSLYAGAPAKFIRKLGDPL